MVYQPVPISHSMHYRKPAPLQSYDAIKHENKCNDKKPRGYEGIVNDDTKEVEYVNATKFTLYGLR